ncbi:MAG TPA: amidohydrolase family protein [Conexibacter sp.]|nr:amidohydrolase family protein [Conexibacter sp.]
MIEDIPVINGIVHAWNIADDNFTGRGPWNTGERIRADMIAWHEHWNLPGMSVPLEAYTTDWSAELIARTTFLESDADLAVHHHIHMESIFTNGLCSVEKNAEMVQRWPDRFVVYAGADPTAGVDQAIEYLKRQMDLIPETLGLKLYPAQVDPIRWFLMDDEKVFPLYEAARDLGIKVIAVHKAMPTGPIPMLPFKMDDIDGAANAFPDLNFEVVHGGMAFIEETSYQIARYPNVFTNFEVTSALLNSAPGWFEEIMAQFLFWGGAEKIIWGDGSPFVHPQPLLEKFWDFEIRDELLAKYNIPQITREDKAKILGGNYARMAGIDVEARLAKIADDELAQERRETGRQAPYSNWRRIAGVAPDATIDGVPAAGVAA